MAGKEKICVGVLVGGVRKQSKPNTTKKQNLKSFYSESSKEGVRLAGKEEDMCVCLGRGGGGT